MTIARARSLTSRLHPARIVSTSSRRWRFSLSLSSSVSWPGEAGNLPRRVPNQHRKLRRQPHDKRQYHPPMQAATLRQHQHQQGPGRQGRPRGPQQLRRRRIRRPHRNRPTAPRNSPSRRATSTAPMVGNTTARKGSSGYGKRWPNEMRTRLSAWRTCI